MTHQEAAPGSKSDVCDCLIVFVIYYLSTKNNDFFVAHNGFIYLFIQTRVFIAVGQLFCLVESRHWWSGWSLSSRNSIRCQTMGLTMLLFCVVLRTVRVRCVFQPNSYLSVLESVVNSTGCCSCCDNDLLSPPANHLCYNEFGLVSFCVLHFA